MDGGCTTKPETRYQLNNSSGSIWYSNFQLDHCNTALFQMLTQTRPTLCSYLRCSTYPQCFLSCTWRWNNLIEQPTPQTWCRNQQSFPCLWNKRSYHLKKNWVRFTPKKHCYSPINSYVANCLTCSEQLALVTTQWLWMNPFHYSKISDMVLFEKNKGGNIVLV